MVTRRPKQKLTKTVEADIIITLFDMGVPILDQGHKVLEEASETFNALQKYLHHVDEDSVGIDQVGAKWDILDEAADLFQATSNLLYILGFDEYDVREAMIQCAKKNKDRGRI